MALWGLCASCICYITVSSLIVKRDSGIDGLAVADLKVIAWQALQFKKEYTVEMYWIKTHQEIKHLLFCLQQTRDSLF